MKKWIALLVCLICLCFSRTASASTGSLSFLYECGEWNGAACGSYGGELAGEKPNGMGTLTFTYGGSYTGNFINSHPSGTGTYTYANGNAVGGTFGWTSGTAYVMEKPTSGDAPHYNGADMVYVGMTKDGKPCGFGALDFQDGGTFYGEFQDGTVKGKGVYVYREAEGAEKVTGSDWKMVRRVPSSLGGRWYSGLISGGNWQGYGMLCYNYSYYIGEVKDNYCNGHGTYWQWSQSGDPSGTLTRKDYGHYQSGGMAYSCSHGSKQTVYGEAAVASTGSSTGLTKFSSGEYGFWVTENGIDRFYQQATIPSNKEYFAFYAICVEDTELPCYYLRFEDDLQSAGDSFYMPDVWKGSYDNIQLSMHRTTSLVDGHYNSAVSNGYSWTCTITKADGKTFEGIIEGNFCKGATYGEFRFLEKDLDNLLKSFHAKMVWDRFWGNYEDSDSGNDTISDGATGGQSTTQKTKDHRDCGVCGGNGKCHICSGTGTVSCSGCHSSGKCRSCNGKGGRIQNKKWTDCISCGGSGKCSTCHGTRRMTCSICNGNKKCNACGGSGKSKIS